MKTYKNKNLELEAKIQALQIEQQNDLLALKNELNITYNALRPSQLLNRAIADLKEEPQTTNNLLQAVMGIAGGYLSKKLIVGKSEGIFKKILGYAIQYLTTKLIIKKDS